MTNLPATLVDENEAIAVISQRVAVIEEKMKVHASREWLEATLTRFPNARSYR